ncbi:MAG: hypothetical protein HOC23_11405 [Halieaceae bacterium]|jgi:twitching motility protein PilI|nr:hypothetical protein [Gammaproteobacteria bacterium]MBT4520603.1 hypothetical protein [Halieaceae bacterium]
MALSTLQSLHALEKNYILESIISPEISGDVMQWVGTSLSIAGTPLLVGEGELEEVIETPPLTVIPGTKPWVLGMAGHKGSLLPIFSGDALFRREVYTGRPRDYCMVVRRPSYYFGLTLSGIERDLKFPIEQRIMDHPIDVDFSPFCLGGFEHLGRFLAILDIEKLVGDSGFSNASATTRNSSEGNIDD